MEELKQYIYNLISNNTNIFKNQFYFDKYLKPDFTYQNVVCIRLVDFYEEVDLSTFRNECLNKFNYDIIGLDIDICGVHDIYDNLNSIDIVDKKIIKYIINFCKNKKIDIEYLIYGNKTLGIFCNSYHKFYKKTEEKLKQYMIDNNLGINFIYK